MARNRGCSQSQRSLLYYHHKQLQFNELTNSKHTRLRVAHVNGPAVIATQLDPRPFAPHPIARFPVKGVLQDPCVTGSPDLASPRKSRFWGASRAQDPIATGSPTTRDHLPRYQHRFRYFFIISDGAKKIWTCFLLYCEYK